MDENICSICLCEPTYPYKLPCKHSFCYMCIKRSLEIKKICPECNSIIPEFVLEEAKVSKKDFPDIDERWVYSGRNNGWWYYSSEDSKIIEENWNFYKENTSSSSFNITILGRIYKIDFISMTQSNSYTKRKIKRLEDGEEILIKGIVGLQILNEVPSLPEPKWENQEVYVFQPSAWENE